MKIFASAVLVVSAITLAGQTAPTGGSSKPLLQNARVTAAEVELRGGAVAGSKPDRDTLTVVISGGREKSRAAAGAVFFTPAGSKSRDPLGEHTPLRAVTVEFATPQGAVERKNPPASRYCNPGSKTACVSEKYLLCTPKSCVEEVTMGADAVTTRHSHDTDHMIVAVTDYSLADDVVGKGVVMRDVKSGNIEYIPAGIEHTLTNKSGREVRFVVVVFR